MEVEADKCCNLINKKPCLHWINSQICYSIDPDLAMNLVKQLIADQQALVPQVKKRRRCEDSCSEHLFALTSHHKTKHSLDTEVSFCPKIQRGDQPPESTHPEFNSDGLYYTSAFVLGVDKKIVQQARKQQLAQHLRIVKQTNEKNCRVLFPKPNQKHVRCSVCKLNYYNHYYAHILSDYHKERIKSSTYNQYIWELTRNFQSLHPALEDHLSSPFQLPNHCLNKNQEETNTTEINSPDAQIVDPKQTHFPESLPPEGPEKIQETPKRGKRGKKSTKNRPLKNNNRELSNQGKVSQGQLSFHKIDGITFKNGQIITSDNQGQTPKDVSNVIKQTKVQRKLVKKEQSVERRRKIIQKPKGSKSRGHSKKISSKEKLNKFKIVPGVQQELASISELRVEEAEDEMASNEWIQLQLTSAEQQYIQLQQAQLGLLQPKKDIPQLIDIPQAAIAIQKAQETVVEQIVHFVEGELKQNEESKCEKVQAVNESQSKGLYSWQKLGLSVKQFIKIKLTQQFHKSIDKDIPCVTVQPLESQQKDQTYQTKHSLQTLRQSPEWSPPKSRKPPVVIELQINSIEPTNSKDKPSDPAATQVSWRQHFNRYIISEDDRRKVQQNLNLKRAMKFDYPKQKPFKRKICSDRIIQCYENDRETAQVKAKVDYEDDIIIDWEDEIKKMAIGRSQERKEDKPKFVQRQKQIKAIRSFLREYSDKITQEYGRKSFK